MREQWGAMLPPPRETAIIAVVKWGMTIELSFNDGHSNLRRCQGSTEKDSKLPRRTVS